LAPKAAKSFVACAILSALSVAAASIPGMLESV